MVKLLIVSFHYYPDLCAGSFRSTALVDALKKYKDIDFSVDVITTLPNRYSSYLVEAPKVEKQDNVTIHRVTLPSHKSGMLDQAIAFFYFAYHANKICWGKKYDLVYATSSRLMAAALGAWLSKRTKSKLYLDIRDIFVETISDVFPAKLSKIVGFGFSLIERWTFNRANHINIVSQGFVPYFTKKYFKKSLSCYTNGIDDIFIHKPKQLNLSSKNDSKKTRILYAGNIGEGQGLHHVVPHLAHNLYNYEFYIIGDGGRRKQLEAVISEKKITNVKLINPCSRDVLIENYLQADILFLHLNNYFAFKRVLPSKIFEYAAMGKPILAGVGGYAAEFIKSEVPNSKVFAPCDVEEALRVINDLSEDFHPRSGFIEKYKRSSIMRRLAKELLQMAE